MPLTGPTAHLFGSGLGHAASTWKTGTASADCASAIGIPCVPHQATATSARPAAIARRPEKRARTGSLFDMNAPRCISVRRNLSCALPQELPLPVGRNSSCALPQELRPSVGRNSSCALPQGVTFFCRAQLKLRTTARGYLLL